VRTFAALQNYSTIVPSSDEYFPKDDASEEKQLRDISGVGEEVTYLSPDEVRQYAMNDFGMGFDEEIQR